MSLQSYPARSTTPELEDYVIQIEGAATSDPVNVEARGVAVTRTTTGQYRITWTEDPGTFVGATWGLQAATPGNVAGHTVAFDVYSSKVLDLVFYNATPAAHDLAADEYLTFRVTFKRTAV